MYIYLYYIYYRATIDPNEIHPVVLKLGIFLIFPKQYKKQRKIKQKNLYRAFNTKQNNNQETPNVSFICLNVCQCQRESM